MPVERSSLPMEAELRELDRRHLVYPSLAVGDASHVAFERGDGCAGTTSTGGATWRLPSRRAGRATVLAQTWVALKRRGIFWPAGRSSGSDMDGSEIRRPPVEIGSRLAARGSRTSAIARYFLVEFGDWLDVAARFSVAELLGADGTDA